MKRSRKKILCLVSLIATILLVSGPSSAYFWTGNPALWGHHDEPTEGSIDGSGYASIDNEQGGSCIVILHGGLSQETADPIEKTEEEDGMTCMWVITYCVEAEIYMGHDTRAIVTLELFFYENNDWSKVDTDTVSAVATVLPWDPYDRDDGWLYVWHDSAYEDGDEYKLKATATCQYFIHGGWVNFYGSPATTSVYFVIQEV